ncbi:MAG: hypothetical protein ACE5PV_08535, partial [Candidatus Poribacteria bacterium]
LVIERSPVIPPLFPKEVAIVDQLSNLQKTGEFAQQSRATGKAPLPLHNRKIDEGTGAATWGNSEFRSPILADATSAALRPVQSPRI